MARALSLFWQTLREIFDEAAYERYLRRQGVPSSSKAYEEFQRQLGVRRERRPKCC
jgi:hypothetical protein